MTSSSKASLYKGRQKEGSLIHMMWMSSHCRWQPFQADVTTAILSSIANLAMWYAVIATYDF